MSSCTSQKSFESDSVTIELKGNPSTGYTWEAVLSDENIVEVSKDVKYVYNVSENIPSTLIGDSKKISKILHNILAYFPPTEKFIV